MTEVTQGEGSCRFSPPANFICFFLSKFSLSPLFLTLFNDFGLLLSVLAIYGRLVMGLGGNDGLVNVPIKVFYGSFIGPILSDLLHFKYFCCFSLVLFVYSHFYKYFQAGSMQLPDVTILQLSSIYTSLYSVIWSANMSYISVLNYNRSFRLGLFLYSDFIDNFLGGRNVADYPQCSAPPHTCWLVYSWMSPYLAHFYHFSLY